MFIHKTSPSTREMNVPIVAPMSGFHLIRIIVKNTVSPEILGGVKLRYSGIQLDGSVKTRLDKFEASLKNTVI